MRTIENEGMNDSRQSAPQVSDTGFRNMSLIVVCFQLLSIITQYNYNVIYLNKLYHFRGSRLLLW